MSALMELRGLSLMTMKICSSFSRLMKLPNQDFLASLRRRKRKKKCVFFSSFKFMLFNPVHGECLSSFQQFWTIRLFMYLSISSCSSGEMERSEWRIPRGLKLPRRNVFWLSPYVQLCICKWVCVCVWERERERGREIIEPLCEQNCRSRRGRGRWIHYWPWAQVYLHPLISHMDSFFSWRINISLDSWKCWRICKLPRQEKTLLNSLLKYFKKYNV